MRLCPAAFCMLILALCSCAGARATPAATPYPPPELESLPRAAWIDCRGDPSLDRGGMYLWEYPGITPDDPNSAYMGKRGKAVGEVPYCTKVEVREFAWSETDREFWAKVVTDDTIGWVPLHVLGFAAPRHQGPSVD